MRIKPVVFNYKELQKELPDLNVEIKRKNVVLTNERYVMWGEKLDVDAGIMMLTSVSLNRKYTKETKQTIFDDWKSFLHQFAQEMPEEISRKLDEMEKKEQEEELKNAKQQQEAV